MRIPSHNLKNLAITWLVLTVLVLASALIGLANLGHYNITASVAIAAIQALLVAGFFMKAFYEGKIIWIILSSGVVWFLIMETLTLGDYMSRGWLPVPGK